MNNTSFTDALIWASKRKVVLPDVYYGELQGLARAMSFSIAGVSEINQLTWVLRDLQRALGQGKTFAEWKKTLTTPDLGLPDYRLENIFRTNTQGHYARGRCEQQKRAIRTHPYYLYDAINDSRTRPSHAAMDGYISTHDDPVWKYWTPPCGYQCRCRRIALTSEQAKELMREDDEKLRKDMDKYDARHKALGDGPDEGWDYSVCEAPSEGVKRAEIKQKKEGLPKTPPAAPKPIPPKQAKQLTTMSQFVDEGKSIREQVLKEMGVGSLDELGRFGKVEFRNKIRDMVAALNKGATVDCVDWGDELATRVVRTASKRYPAKWIQASNKRGKILPQRADRGFYRNADGTVSLSGNGGASTLTTAVHELGHRFQYTLNGVDQHFQTYHKIATQGEGLKKLKEIYPSINYRDNELTRRDKYWDAYFGKEYSPTPELGPAREVMTMSLQSVLGDKPTEFYQLLDKSPDLFDLTLGLLMRF